MAHRTDLKFEHITGRHAALVGGFALTAVWHAFRLLRPGSAAPFVLMPWVVLEACLVAFLALAAFGRPAARAVGVGMTVGHVVAVFLFEPIIFAVFGRIGLYPEVPVALGVLLVAGAGVSLWGSSADRSDAETSSVQRTVTVIYIVSLLGLAPVIAFGIASVAALLVFHGR